MEYVQAACYVYSSFLRVVRVSEFQNATIKVVSYQ